MLDHTKRCSLNDMLAVGVTVQAGVETGIVVEARFEASMLY